MEENIRVSELAKELGLTSKEVLEKFAQINISVKSHSNVVTPLQIQKLKDFIAGGSKLPSKKPKAFIVKKKKDVPPADEVKTADSAEKKESKKGFFDSLDEEEKDTKDSDSNDSDTKDKEDINVKTGKSNSYAVNEDTGEILLEEAMDNNAGVNVPPAEDVEDNSIEKAMQSRPFGVDSAFDVVAPEDAPEGENVYVEPEPTEEKNVFADNSGFVDVDEIERQADKAETSDSTSDESVSDESVSEESDSNQKEKSRKKNRKKNKKNKKKVEPQKVALPSQDDEEDE